MTTRNRITRKFGDSNRMVAVVEDASGVVVPIGTWTNFELRIDAKRIPIGNATFIRAASGGLVTNGADGRFYGLVDPTIPVGNYFYQVRALDSNSETVTLLEGEYIVGVAL